MILLNMKKLLGLLSASLLIFASCSSSDSNSSSNLVLLRRTIQTNVSDGIARTTIFSYDGNKIVSEVMDNQYKTIYIYTGNQITKQEYFEYANLIYTKTYTYNGDKLVSFFKTEPNILNGERRNYSYNTDGTVSYDLFVVDNVTKIETKTETGKIFFLNGNFVREDIYDSNGYLYYKTFEYDSKSSPFKNILGFSLLLNNLDLISINNAVKSEDFHVTNGGSYGGSYTFIFNYNSNGYPIEKTKTYSLGGQSISTIKYFYE
jgi:hypothetical protein